MTCIFCGQDTKLTREHVFPHWLETHFPDLEAVEADYIRRGITLAGKEEHTRAGPVFDWVTRNVCEVCNSGWMSQLETQAQPILGPMLSEQPRVLTAVDQAIVPLPSRTR